MPSKRARKVAAHRPIVIGHRGASGYVPEHTLTSYFIAIQQGADYAEPDLVMTKDGVLVARHENEISGTTDVADHAEFARRRTRKSIDGVELEGWFTEDFTLAELKTLRARERIPEIRPANTRFNDQFEIPTFDEILRLIQSFRPRKVGVYPETKHPTYFDDLGLSMDRPLLAALKRYGYKGPKAPVFIQSFEVVNLKRLRKKTNLPMVQLIEAEGSPFNDKRTYAEIISPAGLKEVATYANAIGPNKSLIIPRDSDGKQTAPTSLVRDAHAAGLGLHPWTFRAEANFLPTGTDLTSEIQAFVAAGIDGFFTDQPDIGARVVAELC
jgi:glycerophosphoryl diester phosphodiesterase